MDNFLKKIEKGFTSVLLLVITFLLFINVVLRIFGIPFDWVEEFARYGIIWITFIGASICIYKGAHIGIDSINALLSEKGKMKLNLLTIIISTIFTLIFTTKTFNLVKVVFINNQVSSTLEVPMWLIYGAMPVGGVLMLLRFTQDFIKKYKKLENIEKEED